VKIYTRKQYMYYIACIYGEEGRGRVPKTTEICTNLRARKLQIRDN